MNQFLAKHRKKILVATRLQKIVKKSEVKRFLCVCAFLAKNPKFLSWRGKVRPSPVTQDGINKLAEKYFSARAKKNWPSAPGTVPDSAVGIVLQGVYGYTRRQINRIEVEHKHCMSAENIVGVLLERYISSVLEPRGWVWCAGDFVKAVDFIRYDSKTKCWQAVQVKNRNNTENSASSAIRSGTTIEKWHRTFSKTGRSNWAAFPDVRFRGDLTESGFCSYVRNYLKSQK